MSVLVEDVMMWRGGDGGGGREKRGRRREAGGLGATWSDSAESHASSLGQLNSKATESVFRSLSSRERT